uniref:RING-type E3 ubiquitin transferase n=1 Tax=Albugo laibachii Nc14 TaxID=890382 RepID=F0W2A5_9STRA|nr:putative E3 ubiquitinprotein ligase MARCH6 (membraneassociated RING finger protein 6) [Albugo laibachii Nc14]|eukprot:CCA15190.1 putative E3 ubiquitinprotein ligase MARCH6 (membraneassociated RING finger protein 6) [Albugo laibachii Nc14]
MTDSGTDESHSASPLPADDPMQHQSQEQDEEAECRVCRGEAELERRLFSPCKCSGSIRYAHSDCLEQWLVHSGKKVCELCRYEFKFRPIYDPNTPEVLPWTQLIGSLLKVTCMEWIPFLVRGLLVLVLWSAVAPWCTSWLYRMWLLRASAMVNVNFSERLHPAEIMADIYSGIFLVVCIIFSFLSLISFAEFWRSHLDQENEVVDERMQFPVWPANAAAAREEMEQPQGGQDMEDQDWGEIILQNEDVVEDAEPEAEDENRREPEQELRHRMPERRPVRAMFFADGPDADAIAAVPGHRNDAWEVNNNNNIPPNNRAWEDDMDHLEINIALDELLGFRGDFLVLFRNVSWFLAFNGAHLGLFAFIPYTLGSSILSALGKLLMSVPFWSGMMPMVQNSTAIDENPVVDQTSIVSLIITSLLKHVSLAQKNGDCIQLVDLFTCAMGYVSICFTILLWRFMIKTVSSYTRRPLMGGLIWILRCLGALVKVSSLLFMKMIILPIILGLGIDFATLSLVKASFSGRLLYCLDSMMEAIMVHWVLGITFMLFVTVSVLQLREVLHPDILGRGIRPQEAHTELLRSLLSESYSRHARRLFLSILVYAILLIVVIHTPVRIASWLQPAWFPFTLHFQHYNRQLQVPLELLVIHLVALGILEHTKNEVGHWQHLVIKVTSKVLGLTAFLLPRIKANEVDETQFPQVKKQSEFVLSPPPLHFNPQAAAPPERLRIKGRRYFPWPEDDVEVTAPLEYTLLPRTEVSAAVYARLAALVVICTTACIITVGVSIFGSLLLGRYAMAPIEKISGVSHDPLAMGAGVLIVWFVVHCVNAVSVLLRSDEQIGPVLLQHGFCVKNLTPVNAATCVIGWGFMCPLLVGILLTSCAPALKCTWMECFWLGYLVYNLTVWLYCCFQSARERQEPRPEENFAVDDRRNLLDERDNQALHDDAAPGDRPINAHGAAILIEGHDPRDDDVLEALRQSYQQLNFTLSLLDNDRAHVQNGNLSDRCLDVGRFHDKVLVPVLTTLISALVASSISATIIRALCLSNRFSLMFIFLIENYAFVVSLLSLLCISAFSGARVQFSRWLTSLRDRMRNERYLVGRQLQDRAR